MKAYGVAYGPYGKTLYVVGPKGSVWRLDDGKQIASLPSGGSSVAVRRDGALAIGNSLLPVTIRDPAGAVRTLDPNHGGHCVVFSPDGHTLGVATNDGVQLWAFDDPGSRWKPRRLLGQSAPADCLAFSPNGRTLASAGWDGTVRLFDVASGEQLGQPLFRYVGPAQAYSADILSGITLTLGPVAGVAFSPDGTMLASVHGTGELRLWDVDSREQLGETLQPNDKAQQGVAFSPDGRSLATSAASGAVRLWRGFLWRDTDDLRSMVCGLVIGSISRTDWNRYVPGLAYRSSSGG